MALGRGQRSRILCSGNTTDGHDGERQNERRHGRRPRPFEEKMKRLTAQRAAGPAEAGKLDAAIARNLAQLGWKPEKP